MHISPFVIYLWGIVDQIQTLATVGGGLAAFAGGFGFAFGFFEDEPEAAKIGKKALIGGIVALVISALIPSQKTIACMVILPAIVDSKVVQKDVPELYNMAVESLKEAMKPVAKP